LQINKNVIHGYNIFEKKLNRQYDLIDPYISSWIKWFMPGICGKTTFKHYIPINGIVEAIEKICSNKTFNRFVILQGEVPFYENILKAQKQNYIKINPNNLSEIKSGDLVCISMPFSATASIPDWYKELCDYLEKHNIQSFIDGAYIGTINKSVYIPSTCIFFSLSCSKPFNASGLRSGILCCEEILDSFIPKIKLANYNYYTMETSIELLEKYNCFYVYNYFRRLQEDYCSLHNLICSDSVVLSYTFNLDHNLKDIMIYNDDLKMYRLCMPKVLKS